MTNARVLTSSNVVNTQFSDESLLPFLNMVYHRVENEIVSSIGEDYFTSVFYTNTVAWQERYQRDWDFKKILELAIKWKDTDEYYTVLKQSDNRKDYYYDDRDAVGDNMYYTISWEYLNIYPTPTDAVVQGIKVTAVKNLDDLETSTLSSSIYPWHPELKNMHSVLVTWLKQYIYQVKWDTNRKNDALNEFELELSKTITGLKFKNWEVMEIEAPHLYKYKD